MLWFLIFKSFSKKERNVSPGSLLYPSALAYSIHRSQVISYLVSKCKNGTPVYTVTTACMYMNAGVPVTYKMTSN